MELNDIKSVYFIGAGGIGMSALARYFLAKGLKVGGYDRVPTELTHRLEAEGADLHYEDNVELIEPCFKDKGSTLVVYTPAIPHDHTELRYYIEQGFELQKRAQVLGTLSRALKALCVAGTHGKTTTTTMAAHLLHESHVGCNAFLGGISKNHGTNYLYSEQSPYVVVEADEFDRSFHQLRPWATVITACDADHLDIYGTEEAYIESFEHYSSLVQNNGTLILHTNLKMQARPQNGVKIYTYSRNEGDFHAENIKIGGGEIVFDYKSPLGNIDGVRLGVPVSINIENGIAALALVQLAGAKADELRAAMDSFEGVERRFDFKVKNDRHVVLSDYAHHPEEIKQSIMSLREVFDGRKLTAIFQPHLYSRTRDFYREFAESLSLLDDVVLTEIYPAREEPIEGVSSEMIYSNTHPKGEKYLINKKDVLDFVGRHYTDVLVILGAGDLDDYTNEIADIVSKQP